MIPHTLHRESLVFDLLDNSNYASWRKNMHILFMRMSLLDLIDHLRAPDATPSWDTTNKWAFSEIYFRCRSNIQASLSDIMTARQAWTSLEDVFQSSSTANIFQLTLVFNTLHQRVGQPVFTFINDVVAPATDLRYLGEDVSDQKIKWQILVNLLPEYASLVTTLTNLDRDDDPLDIRDIQEFRIWEERTSGKILSYLLGVRRHLRPRRMYAYHPSILSIQCLGGVAAGSRDSRSPSSIVCLPSPSLYSVSPTGHQTSSASLS